jgi:hypothetical protein
MHSIYVSVHLTITMTPISLIYKQCFIKYISPGLLADIFSVYLLNNLSSQFHLSHHATLLSFTHHSLHNEYVMVS